MSSSPVAFEFDLHPGDRLGPFSLGSSLWSVLEYLRQQQTAYPQITVSFDNTAPSTSPVLLHVRPYADLLFTPTEQRLHTISISHIGADPPLILRYNSVLLLSPDIPLRRSDVSRVFGPTYAGSTMRYPGLSFSFDDDGPNNLGKKPSNEDRGQPVKRLTITQQTAPSPTQTAIPDLDFITPCHAMEGELERATFTIGEGATLRFFTLSAQSKTIILRLGETRAQDALVELGPPLRIHHKDDDRMAIHAKSADSPSELRGYFYNYFQHGFDLLFSDSTHKLDKIVVHSNVPGSPLFQRYQRCPWEIQISSRNSTPITLKNKIDDVTGSGSAPHKMQVDRSEDPSITLPSAVTHLTGMDGVAFESTEMGVVVSFTLF